MTREMIDSGIKWIGRIPSDWKMIPNKYLFIEHCNKVGDNWKDYQLLSLTTKGVREKDINTSGGKVPDSYDNYQIVKPGDMIFCLFDLDVSAVFSGLSNLNGMITSAYNVCSVNNKLVNESFANYWFQYVFSNRYYKIYSKNIRYTVTNENFGLIATVCPPLLEQMKIGNYLDKKIFQIDKLIANQEKQIEALKAYKQSLITKVVTKGLNPDVQMKDSGVDSSGFVLSHWHVCRSKYVFTELLKGAGISKDDIFENGNIQCVRYGEIYTKYDISFKETFSKTFEDRITSKVFLNKGDIIFSATGELVEEIGKNVVYLGNDKCLAGGDIIVGKHSENPEFLNYAMYCSASQLQKSKGKHHVTILKQIKIGISTNSYLLVNNALLSIIDNCLSLYLENKGRSKRKGIFKPIINVFENCYIKTIPEFYFNLNILSNNIDWLFEDYTFGGKIEIESNKKIRRHPALHGVKYSNKRIDTIMLLNNLFSLIKIKPYIRVFENSIICSNKEFCLNKKGKLNASFMLIKFTIDDILSIDNKFSYKDVLECIKEVNIFEKIDSNEKKLISKVLQSLKMKGIIKYNDGYWYKNI